MQRFSPDEEKEEEGCSVHLSFLDDTRKIADAAAVVVFTRQKEKRMRDWRMRTEGWENTPMIEHSFALCGTDFSKFATHGAGWVSKQICA